MSKTETQAIIITIIILVILGINTVLGASIWSTAGKAAKKAVWWATPVVAEEIARFLADKILVPLSHVGLLPKNTTAAHLL